MNVKVTIKAINIPLKTNISHKDRSTILEYNHSPIDHRRPDRTR
jgi:hypothetical protein